MKKLFLYAFLVLGILFLIYNYSFSIKTYLKCEPYNQDSKEILYFAFDKKTIWSNYDPINSKFKNQKINFVISSAIKNENEELKYCQKKNLLIKHRSEILAMIMKSKLIWIVLRTNRWIIGLQNHLSPIIQFNFLQIMKVREW